MTAEAIPNIHEIEVELHSVFTRATDFLQTPHIPRDVPVTTELTRLQACIDTLKAACSEFDIETRRQIEGTLQEAEEQYDALLARFSEIEAAKEGITNGLRRETEHQLEDLLNSIKSALTRFEAQAELA